MTVVPQPATAQLIELPITGIDFGDPDNIHLGDRPFTVTPPAGSTTVPLSLHLLGEPAPKNTSLSIPLAPGSPRAPIPQTGYQVPSTVMPGDTPAIRGAFTGNSRTTLIALDGVPLVPLTETPRSARVQIPTDTAPGSHVISVQGAFGEGWLLPLNVVTIAMSADRLNLLRGQSTPFHVVISGPDKLPDSSWKGATAPRDVDFDVLRRTPGFKMPGAGEEGRIFLRLENTTRGTVTMRPGRDEVELRSLSQSEFRNGPYRMDGVITSRVAGTFTVDGLVVPFLAPVTASHAPPSRDANPLQQGVEGVGRLRNAIDNVRQGINRGLDGEKLRGLLGAARRTAEHVYVSDGNQPSWNFVAGAPQLEWLMFASDYDEFLVRIQHANGRPGLSGELHDLVGLLHATHLLLESEKLPDSAREALVRLGMADGDLRRAIDAGDGGAVTRAIEAARAAKHMIFDTLPEFAQATNNGLPRKVLFDLHMAEAEALERAREAATPDSLGQLLSGNYDKDALTAALAKADDAAKTFEARLKR